MASTPGVPIERLLAQREWVRALARTLVRDEAGADDLEQQAWLEAIERPPLHDAGLRGWFATVLRRRARDAWRAAGRRETREAAAARPREGRPTADLVAEAEAQRLVVEVLLSLEEPYREVLLLRFFEDLPPAAIALRKGASRETVKTRLRRALALLRERLDGGRGGREWRLALVPVGGGILMRSSTKAGIAAALLATLCLSWWALSTEPVPDVASVDPESLEVPTARPALQSAEATTPVVVVPKAVPPPAPIPVQPTPAAVPRGRLPLVVAVKEVPPAAGRIDIEVDARGGVSVGGQSLDMAGLLGHLKEKADARREEEAPRCSLADAVLRVDRDLPWQGAQWLMQACAEPDVRIARIHFAVAPDSGGEEGVLPTFLPRDVGARQDDVELEEDGTAGERPPQAPTTITVRLTRTGAGAPAAPRDLYSYLDDRFPGLRSSGFQGEVDATPSVSSGDVLAVVDVMLRSGMSNVLFKGTRIHRGATLEASLADMPAPEGALEISVLGTPIGPK